MQGISYTDGPQKCTWHIGIDSKESPHVHIPSQTRPKIMDTILDNIGNTPLVRLNRIPQSENIDCEILVKCEFFNAGGSVKDRIGKRMVEDAEKEGRIKPGDTLIEPTSGNTGIGLALAAAVKGYRMIVTMPEKMSQEKVDVLKALGAEIIRTPTEAAFDSPESHIGVAMRLQKDLDNAHILDQYKNPSNPLAHYDGTAEELLYQTDGKLDAVVVSAGTGGTITGIARKLKEKLPNIKIIGVDPIGSILAQPDTLNGEITSYQVEGIGYDFIPTVLDRSVVDFWIKSRDKESFQMSRRLIAEEGLLCGGSCGAAVSAALEAVKQLQFGKGKRVAVILADSVRNYMTKFLNDDWMSDHGFASENSIGNRPSLSTWWANVPVSALKLETPITIQSSTSCKQAVRIMEQHGVDQLPVIGKEGDVLGVVSELNILSKILHGRVESDVPVEKAVYRKFKQVSLRTTLAELSKIFENHHFALIVSTQKCFGDDDSVSEKTLVYGVVTRIDLLNYIMADHLPHDS